MKPKLGFVGLGNIGEPICRNLLGEGYEIAVHDASPEAMARLGDTGAQPVGSPKDLGAVADVVLLSLPNSAVVEKV
ncbi:MAG: NAD(P)-binding domain-containing protein, partial [Actinomycetota bacterium]|nr:NAD(P)-binding domain-containing protein [Actinomycetota bacterium]